MLSEYNNAEDDLICEKDVKLIPEEMRCVYDEDAAGFITGCRSRSHLENCGMYMCLVLKRETTILQSLHYLHTSFAI